MGVKFIANKIIQDLYDAGAITTDPRYVRRVVIDIPAGGVARVLIETFADSDKVTPEVVADIINTIEQRDPDDTQVGVNPLTGAELHK
jgi:hypothetical protein